MFGRNTLAELETRKNVLVLESEVNRLTLRMEWRHLGASAGWITQAARFCREANPWLTLLAPLVGMWTARTLHRETSVLRKLIAALKWLPPLLAVWRNFTATQSEQKPPPPPA